MNNALWAMLCAGLLFLAVQACLSGRSQRSLDEASMLPFADDPEAAREMEEETGRSNSGCACPGRCQGNCNDWHSFSA